jgi:DNA-binding MarR family transcriptional regulator
MALPAFNIVEIDDVIHSRVRLGVMAYLMAADAADFNTLKAKLDTTDGTLSVHLRKLEDAGYIVIEKSFRNRRPLTETRLTPSGRRAFRGYLNAIAKLARLGD